MIMQHLQPETYYFNSSSATHPPKLKPAPVDSQDHFAVLVAEFRDLYPGTRELFDLAWWQDPIMFLMMKKMLIKDEVDNKLDINIEYRE